MIRSECFWAVALEYSTTTSKAASSFTDRKAAATTAGPSVAGSTPADGGVVIGAGDAEQIGSSEHSYSWYSSGEIAATPSGRRISNNSDGGWPSSTDVTSTDPVPVGAPFAPAPAARLLKVSRVATSIHMSAPHWTWCAGLPATYTYFNGELGRVTDPIDDEDRVVAPPKRWVPGYGDADD